MATLALPLGGLLRSLPPLRAYAVDISGSLAGIAGFGLLSAAWAGFALTLTGLAIFGITLISTRRQTLVATVA